MSKFAKGGLKSTCRHSLPQWHQEVHVSKGTSDSFDALHPQNARRTPIPYLRLLTERPLCSLQKERGVLCYSKQSDNPCAHLTQKTHDAGGLRCRQRNLALASCTHRDNPTPTIPQQRLHHRLATQRKLVKRQKPLPRMRKMLALHQAEQVCKVKLRWR